MDFKCVRLRYTENGEEFSFTIPGGTVQTENVSLKVTQKGRCISVRVRAEEEIVLEELCAVYSHAFNESDRIFLNGYQSWTSCREMCVDEIPPHTTSLMTKVYRHTMLGASGAYNFVDNDSKPGEFLGFSYMYIRNGEHYDLFASLNERTGYTVFLGYVV